jgi:hypothetical protein
MKRILILLFFPITVLVQQASPELSLTANGTQDVNLYSGWPLIVHATIMNSLRFNKTGNVPPLVIAPNGAAWTSAIQFTAISSSGQSFQWPLKLVGTPADAALTLQGSSYVRFTLQMAPSDVSSLVPDTYQLTASLGVSNSSGWNGMVQSGAVTIQVGPEPTLTPNQLSEKALLIAEYDTNAGDLDGALTNVEQLLQAQPNNPSAMSAAANLLELQGYPTLAFFQANDALIAYYQANPASYDPPSNLLSMSQRLSTRLATPGSPVADTIPPITTATLSPQPNPAGWNNTNVKVTLNSKDEDGGSGVKQITYGATGAQPIATTSVNAASYPILISSEGITVLNFFGTDNAGNAETPESVTIKLDKTPPTISATSRNPLPNAHGWNNTNVTVHFDCSDSLSGLAPASGPIDAVVSGEGANQSVTETCQDVAGNSASATANGINIDKTPPTIAGSRAPVANSFGWNNTDVTVSFACADSLSGIDTCGPSPQIVTSEGLNQSRTGTAVDLAGNSATAVVGNLNIDKTPPSISCTADPSVLWPPNNKLVSVTVSVSLSDSLSGTAGFTLVSATSNEPDSGLGDIQGFAAGTASTSGQLRAQRLGSGNGRVYTLKYSGTDRAGNSATCSTTVSVPHDQGQ